jgi:predicted DNA-binding protein YlxM (UPF0122 family)
MGRKAVLKKRKPITNKVKNWLSDLLIKIQYENLEDLTIDDLAKLAGISKSTVYEYFKSKEEILCAACETKVEVLVNELALLRDENISTNELYEKFVELFANGTSDISIGFLQSIKKYYPNAWVLIESFIESYLDLLKMQYTKGMSEGIYTKTSIELLINIDKIFVLQVVTNFSLFNDKTYTLSQLIREYLNLRLNGLLK